MDDLDQVLHELVVGGDKLMKLVVEASFELAPRLKGFLQAFPQNLKRGNQVKYMIINKFNILTFR